MKFANTIFDVSHDDAFEQLGARKPGQHWSAFDVSSKEACLGKANILVTSIWNFHRKPDEKGHRRPTEKRAITKDKSDGTYWYRVDIPPAVGTKRKTWVAHWKRLKIAIENQLPIIGVLKDAHSKKCSINNLFDCVNPRFEANGKVMWLQLIPRDA